MIKDKIDYQRERRIRHRIIAKSVFNTRILCPDSYRSRWSGMAFHSLLQRHFAPRKVVHLPSLRSRMTGRYLLSFCKKTLLPFYSRFPLPTADAATFPVFGDGLKLAFFPLFPSTGGDDFCVRHFIIFRFCSYKTAISFPVYYFPCL